MPLVSEAENFSNLELSKITTWSASNKIRFNEEKSKVMLISRRERKEINGIKLYLNKKNPLEHVNTMKYLGIIVENKLKFSAYIATLQKDVQYKTNSQLIQIGQSIMGPQT